MFITAVCVRFLKQDTRCSFFGSSTLLRLQTKSLEGSLPFLENLTW